MDYDLIKDEELTSKDWQQIKISDPERYRNFTHGIIQEKLDRIIPILEVWQKDQNKFHLYRLSLRTIESAINLLDLSIYDDLKGKHLLTELYFKHLSMFDTQSIFDFVSRNMPNNEWKIKNLLTRSFSLLDTLSEFSYKKYLNLLSLGLGLGRTPTFRCLRLGL